MKRDLDGMVWPVDRIGSALEALARTSGLATADAGAIREPAGLAGRDREALGGWIEAAAAVLGLEAEPVGARYPDLEALLGACGPALAVVPAEDGPRVMAVVRSRGRRLELLGTDLRVRRIRIAAIRSALCEAIEAPERIEVDALLARAGVVAGGRRVRAALLAERLGPAWIDGFWLLRLPPEASVARHARRERLTGRLASVLALHAAEYGLWIAAWALVGAAALGGRFEPGWLAGWGLLLATLVLLRLAGAWRQGSLAITAGTLLKRRILRGALSLDPEEIRHEGVGRLLARVIEAGAVESLATGGGLLSLTAAVELVLAASVLAAGAGGWTHALLLAGWTTVIAVLAGRYFVRRRQWTRDRLGLTNDLVERMVGHRTRMVQETRERRHAGEDEKLDRYLSVAEDMDGRGALLAALAPRGWRIVGLVGLIPAFLTAPPDAPSLAVALGGVVLAHAALARLAAGLGSLAGAGIAWAQVAPLVDAATRDRGGSPRSLETALASAPDPAPGSTLLEAREVTFRYRPKGERVLNGCNVRIRRGDRLLLGGESGGGKSTLASILTGQRQPESGLLLLDGLDPATVGPAHWRRRVVMVPQFHENHVLTETFAFNLLFGRCWPPSQADVEEAESVCELLGLGDLLGRMPAGLQQMVGESGWQLSHGERSRLFIARALLQRADVVVLDESFAALDPESLDRAMGCVVDRAPALVVIAHP